jgi:hypothetical protein
MERTRKRTGRPATSPYSRPEQLRLAKRAQRERERRAGVRAVALKLPAREADRLRAAVSQPGFAERLGRFLDEELIDIDAYENLKGLCWNRRGRYLAAEEALRLYERNWRFVDSVRMKPEERELIKRLATRFGNGILHV